MGRRRISDLWLGRNGNRRCGRNRREQKDRLTEQLGAAARHKESSTESLNELEKRFDRSLDLPVWRATWVTHVGEDGA
jgi:hypothetical protein